MMSSGTGCDWPLSFTLFGANKIQLLSKYLVGDNYQTYPGDACQTGGLFIKGGVSFDVVLPGNAVIQAERRGMLLTASVPARCRD
jgi:hypothetical protein